MPVAGSPAVDVPVQFPVVEPSTRLRFPADYGAHPDFRTEWWYITGWLDTVAGETLGFQLTFFRSRTGLHEGNPSRYAPRQLLFAHAALSDFRARALIHDERAARSGPGARFTVGETALRIGNWQLERDARSDTYLASVSAREFSYTLSLAPAQATPWLQGRQGFSQKGPNPEQASHYYSRPHMKVTGTLRRAGQAVPVTGTAWLDHEWSSTLLDPRAAGWDWVGANLEDGGSLLAFRIRDTQNQALWSHAAWRGADGRVQVFGNDQVKWRATRWWTAPATGAQYPVANELLTGDVRWEITPAFDAQELNARASTGTIYWEGAVRLLRDRREVGRGYQELTGYAHRLRF